LKTATEQEKAAIQQRIGHSLENRVIRLKEGAQAYTATFFGQPEIAKNVKRIFLSVDDGGYYERIFGPEMTAEKVIIAHKIKTFVDSYVSSFATLRRKSQASDNLVEIYTPILGASLAAKHGDVVHQVMPQCSLFLCGTIYRDLVNLQQVEAHNIPETLEKIGINLIQEHLEHIIDFAKGNKDKADRSWPVLLKSNAFYNYVMAYMEGIRKASNKAA